MQNSHTCKVCIVTVLTSFMFGHVSTKGSWIARIWILICMWLIHKETLCYQDLLTITCSYSPWIVPANPCYGEIFKYIFQTHTYKLGSTTNVSMVLSYVRILWSGYVKYATKIHKINFHDMCNKSCMPLCLHYT